MPKLRLPLLLISVVAIGMLFSLIQPAWAIAITSAEQIQIDQLVNRATKGEYIANDEHLVRLGEKAGPALEKLIDDSHAEVRRRALQGLAVIDFRVTENALRLLRMESSPSYKVEYLQILMEKRDARSKSAIIAVARDQAEDINVRATAISALAGLHGDDVLDALASTHQSDNRLLRRSSILSLANFRSDRAVNLLAKDLKDDDPDIRRAAIYSLASISTPKCLPQLLTALDDKDITNRRNAIRAIGLQANKEPIARLIQISKVDKDPETALLARYAIERINELGINGDIAKAARQIDLLRAVNEATVSAGLKVSSFRR